MPQSPIAPLIVANDKEKTRTWEEVETPAKLAEWFSRTFAVDLSVVLASTGFYIGPNLPTGANSGKVHFKTSAPYGIGFNAGGVYRYIYQWPVNVPIQYLVANTESIPNELRLLTDQEIIDYNLTGNNAGFYYWCILEI